MVPITPRCVPAVPVSTTWHRSRTQHALQDLTEKHSEISSKYDGDKQFRKLLGHATKTPYHFLYLRLNDAPATAFECFTNKIYTAKMLGSLDVDFGNMSMKTDKKDDEEEDDQ
eukprot:m.1529149 g.1529149  ORF g.1529149 m.1529149 type:complete len:113 (-) comp25238_c1_seq33:438-776(-)